MKHIVCFSGGKDSTALVLWAKEHLPEFTAVFCDTGWEHPITYDYIEEINRTQLDGKLVTIKSEKYSGGMRDLVQLKGRVPSAKARFCTDNLKVKPMIAYLKTIDDDDLTVYQGIRANESQARAHMPTSCWDDCYGAQVERPLFTWSAKDCFDLMKKHGVKPNPLYLLGAGRVGCFPCVMINHRELKALSANLPEIRVRIIELEELTGRTFFPPNYIPERFCGRSSETDSPVCWAKNVFAYLDAVTVDQLPLLPVRTCMSVYNLCE